MLSIPEKGHSMTKRRQSNLRSPSLSRNPVVQELGRDSTPVHDRGSSASLLGYRVGDKVRLTQDIYDYGEDHHPPGHTAVSGDLVVIRKVFTGGKGGERFHVSHPDVTDRAFLVYGSEFESV